MEEGLYISDKELFLVKTPDEFTEQVFQLISEKVGMKIKAFTLEQSLTHRAWLVTSYRAQLEV